MVRSGRFSTWSMQWYLLRLNHIITHDTATEYDAMKLNKELSQSFICETLSKYDSYLASLVVSQFDIMKYRRQPCRKWKSQLQYSDTEKKAWKMERDSVGILAIFLVSPTAPNEFRIGFYIFLPHDWLDYFIRPRIPFRLSHYARLFVV